MEFFTYSLQVHVIVMLETPLEAQEKEIRNRMYDIRSVLMTFLHGIDVELSNFAPTDEETDLYFDTTARYTAPPDCYRLIKWLKTLELR